ncbi:cellulase family glycosylhydrolase [Micromonospora deserti]|uniref:cellulase family glycosylhydrolase n=1 Tax=Micromonospora deserti TaxID=2070366 RepID=UPI001F1958D4|nr:cellulase family glycosylhydrolase [Micromonospora deserti]
MTAGLALLLAVSAGEPQAAAARTPAAETALPAVTVVARTSGHGWALRDAHGREVTLRGFNVSGSTKLYENDLLPFRSVADAATSAQAMRDLTGANAIRFLISWEGVQPTPTGVDTSYLDRAAAQIREFTDRGFYVLLDYHQDLYSAHLFHEGSWYTGDGAPQWVIAGGNYPRESCGICLLWGQNMQNNAAVRRAMYDFWHNRTITTPAGPVAVQTAYLTQATAALTHLRRVLPATAYGNLLGVDPFNEPFDGGTDGASGTAWEQTYLLPFYQRFRAAMDAAGWADKPLYAEPLVFWNTGFFESGGLSTVGALGTRYVFNSHYYDGARMTLDPSPATDGTYAAAMNRIRNRAAQLGTAPIVSEFGNKLTGTGSDRTPWMVRAMYQAMDAGVAGADWWARPRSGGAVLSSMMWHWDIYNDRHHELMNGNPDKVLTENDAWNDEDHSVVYVNEVGDVVPRLDHRVLDRVYPSAVAGETLAFTYEDLARSGYGGAGTERAWLTVPPSMPHLAALLAGRQYGVLVWRQPPTAPTAPTVLHLPASFDPARTVVVGDLDTRYGLPSTGAVSVATEPGSTTAHRLVVDAPAGSVHVLLVANTADGRPVSPATLAGARAELLAWAAPL